MQLTVLLLCLWQVRTGYHSTGFQPRECGRIRFMASAISVYNMALVSWDLELGTWNLVPGTWFLEFGTWLLELGIWYLVPGIWYLVLELKTHHFRSGSSFNGLFR